jgi:hypothetical protein
MLPMPIKPAFISSSETQPVRVALLHLALSPHLRRVSDFRFCGTGKEMLQTEPQLCATFPNRRSELSWQNAYVEHLIGSIRRECLDHVIILHESGLRHMLRSYFAHYGRSRTHLGLGKDAPIPRAVQPHELGRVVGLPQVGGLHHRYERRAA